MSVLGEPIPHELTDETAPLTVEDVALALGITLAGAAAIARRGRVEAIKRGRRWLFPPATVQRLLEEPRGSGGRLLCPCLPAGPLMREIDARGGPGACGVRPHSAEERALIRARHEGRLTYAAADKLATRVLKVHPLEVWGDAWLM